MRQPYAAAAAMLAAGMLWTCQASQTQEPQETAPPGHVESSPALNALATAPVAQARTVKLQQVSVQSPESVALLNKFREFRDRASSNESRMQVMLLISAPGDEILRADVALETAQDDTGKSMAGSLHAMRPASWDNATNVSLNRHEALLGLEFTEGPANEAREIQLKGTVHLRLGISRKSTVRMIDLVPQMLAFDDLELRLTTVSGEGQYMNLTFRGPDEVERLSNLVISDGKGGILSGAARVDRFRGPVEMSVGLNALVERVQVDATWFNRVEDVQLPFDVKATVGL